MAAGSPEHQSLQAALRRLVADVTAGRDSALGTFDRWCREHRVEIEFLALFVDPPQGENPEDSSSE